MKELAYLYRPEPGGASRSGRRSPRRQGDGETVLELRVAPEDMGKVIGRQGRIAKEIRTLMRSVAQRQGKKVSVEIVD